jgi:hypothetical protein
MPGCVPVAWPSSFTEAKHHPSTARPPCAAATKFIGGHSDVTAGILAVRDPALAERVYFVQNAEGTALGPFDSWLLVRGLKTMSLRMERQTANAQRIAEWLAAHPMVSSVNYPGLAGHPGRAVHEAQASSAGSVLSFITNDAVLSKAVCEETELFKITVSFGNVCSLIRSAGVCKWVCECARASAVSARVSAAAWQPLVPASSRSSTTSVKTSSAVKPTLLSPSPTRPSNSRLPPSPCPPACSMPCFMSHASIPAEVRAARGLPDDLVRISVGIEDADDLIADLEQAFQKAAVAAAPAAPQPAAAAGQA